MGELNERRKGYLSIKEAAVRYEVSRAKVHRLIQAGRLETQKDPRDERITLLREDELGDLFNFPAEEVHEDMHSETMEYNEREVTGRLTTELRARIDVLRLRVSRGRDRVADSTEIIREERDRRSRGLYESGPQGTGLGTG